VPQSRIIKCIGKYWMHVGINCLNSQLFVANFAKTNFIPCLNAQGYTFNLLGTLCPWNAAVAQSWKKDSHGSNSPEIKRWCIFNLQFNRTLPQLTVNKLYLWPKFLLILISRSLQNVVSPKCPLNHVALR